MVRKDYYSVLGIREDASTDEIKRAFRELAKKYHPDRNPGNRRAEERFKEINEAHEVLADPKKRARYDQFRRFGAGAATEGVPFDEFMRGARGGTQAQGAGSDFSDFSDFFSQFFDRRDWFRQGDRGAGRGEDTSSDAEIPFALAIDGGEVRVHVSHTVTCSTCGGSGAERGTQVSSCTVCGGTGVIVESRGAFSTSSVCPHCLGRGSIIARPCRACNGAGTRSVPQTINVRIPAGVEDGTTLRIRGQGEAGAKGGPPGDLLLTVRVAEDRFFKRKGANVYVDVPLNIAQAILGSQIRIRTPRGKKVLLSIPPGTQNGKTFRLRGMGLETKNAVGDMFVTLHVETPSKLTPEQRKLVERFAELGGLKY